MPFLESNYTMELRYLVEDKNFHLFNFEYDFYDNDLKPIFEKLFEEYYYFNEIGFETIPRFKKMLQRKLNIKAPYYKELYKTINEGNKCNFMLNKDLKETFVREITGMENTLSKNVSDGNSQNNINNIDRTSFKESNLDNGIAELTDNKITLENLNIDTVESVNKTNTSFTNNNEGNKNNSEKETTTLISQGNIGITSSGELLQSWRESILNLNEVIINDLRDLFMLVY